MGVPQKLNIALPYDPGIPLLDIFPKGKNPTNSKNICAPIFTAALFTIAKIRKQPKCPSIGEQIKKMWYTYIYYTHTQWNITQP